MTLSEHVLLRHREKVVGFGKCVLDTETGGPATELHGHHLRQFAKANEELVSVHSIQIFTEFENQPYPYAFKCFDDPPVLLGDLNKIDKCFKQVIAWDIHKLVDNPCSSLTKLGSAPRAVAAGLVNSILGDVKRSPAKVRFAQETAISLEEVLLAKRRKPSPPIYRSFFDKTSTSLNNRCTDNFRDAHADSDDDKEHESILRCERNPLDDTHKIPSDRSDLSPSPLRTTGSPHNPDQLRLSDSSYHSIQLSISAGEFDESIDQFDEERKALEELQSEKRSQSSKSVQRCRSKTLNDTSRKRSVREMRSRDVRDICLSPAERIMKRVSGARFKTRQVQSHSERTDTGVPDGNVSRATEVRSTEDGQMHTAQLQTNSFALGHDMRLESVVSTPQLSGSLNFESQSHPPPVSVVESINPFRLRNNHIPEAPRQLSAGISLQAQPLSHYSRLNDARSPRSMVFKRRQYRFKTRQRSEPKRISRRTETRMIRLEQSFVQNPFDTPRSCCNAGCFYLMNPEYTVIQYRRFLKMNRQDRKRTLKSMYVLSARAFWFGGLYVCTRFLSKGLGFSNQLQCAVKGTPKARASSSILAVPRDTATETKKNQIILYLRDLAERIGDSLPTKPHINLPLMSKKQVFERFQKFNRDFYARENPSLSYWCDIWKRACSDIKTHRHHGFTVCDSCEKIRVGFEMAENERMEAVLRSEMEAHYSFVDTERRDYERRRDLSRRYPKKYLSLILDGADQKSYGLPHFVFPTKEDKGHKMKTKIVGVLEHGVKKLLTLYTLTEEFESGANHIIEALHRTLGRTKERLGTLPPVLFVQADNCTRENKNRFFTSYLELLVRKGVFREVHLSFLPIGHTHSDIDQAFSSVATRFRLERAITSQDMLELLRNCYNPRAHAEAMDKIANFSGLCTKTRCLRNVTGFSQFRFFRFTREEGIEANRDVGSEFVTKCDVKIQALDEWCPLDNSSNKAGFLKFTPDLRRTPATDTTPPDNVLEVNKHFRSCEHRMQSTEKLRLLEELRDRVYTRRQQPFHWNIESCLEENGDYLLSGGVEEESEFAPDVAIPEEEDEPCSSNLNYSVNFFIAVKTQPSCSDPFWIARTLSVADVDQEGNAKKLKVRWYQAKETEDAFKSVYVMSSFLRDGRRTVFDDTVDVRSILCEFESLTNRGCLHTRTQKAIRQTLHMH